MSSRAWRGLSSRSRLKGRAMEKITTWLWFDTEAEEAAEFYTSVFPDSRITERLALRRGRAAAGGHGHDRRLRALRPRVLRAERRLERTRSRARASRFMVDCESQDEVDRYWSKLADGGQEIACGWVTDRYGLSWQIVPKRLRELLADPDHREGAARDGRDAEDDEDRDRGARAGGGRCIGCRPWRPPSQPRPGSSSSTGAS